MMQIPLDKILNSSNIVDIEFRDGEDRGRSKENPRDETSGAHHPAQDLRDEDLASQQFHQHGFSRKRSQRLSVVLA